MNSKMLIFCTFIILVIKGSVRVDCRPSEGVPSLATKTKFLPKERLNFFDAEIFDAMVEEEIGKNMIMSPLGVKMILGILMESTEGVAREEIRKALRLPANEDAARNIMREWFSQSEADSEVTLSLATQLFIEAGHKISENYTEKLHEYYSSDVTEIDVSNKEKASAIVNQWANESTKGLIPVLIDKDQIFSEASLLIASAVHFKGSWQKPFEKTSVGCFRKSDGLCKEVVFMRTWDSFQYAYVGSLDTDVLEMPYRDPRYSMILMVPRNDLRDLIRDLPHEPIQKVVGMLKSSKVNVSVPRFTAQYGQDIRKALKKLNIKEIFSSNLNLPWIDRKDNETFGLGNIFHSAKVKVNEEGSEAAGAVIVEIRPNIQMYEENVTFSADKPFIFFIRDTKRKITLFSGVVLDPEPTKTDFLGVSYIKDPATYSPTKTDLKETYSGDHTSPPPIYKRPARMAGTSNKARRFEPASLETESGTEQAYKCWNFSKEHQLLHQLCSK